VRHQVPIRRGPLRRSRGQTGEMYKLRSLLRGAESSRRALERHLDQQDVCRLGGSLRTPDRGHGARGAGASEAGRVAHGSALLPGGDRRQPGGKRFPNHQAAGLSGPWFVDGYSDQGFRGVSKAFDDRGHGTWVGGERADEAEISNQDEFTVGSTTLMLIVTGGPSA